MTVSKLVILGIDPGLETTGISVLQTESNNLNPIYCDFIATSKNLKLDQRLEIIFNSIADTIKKYQPNCLAIEEIFFSVNAKSAIKVGQARGVAILAASINGLEVHEYTPLQVKQAVVGYGRASKDQIKFMLKNILGKKDDFFPKKDDAWDAMALCICHANSYKFKQKTRMGKQ